MKLPKLENILRESFKFANSRVFKLCLLTALITVIIKQIDLPVLIYDLEYFRFKTVVLGICLFLLSALTGLVRWWDILNNLNVGVPFNILFNTYFASLFTNVVIPGSIGGEALKLVSLRRHNISTGKILNSLLLDRVGGILACIVTIIFATPYMLTNIDNVNVFNVTAAIASALSIGLIFLLNLDRILTKKKPNKIQNYLINLCIDAKSIIFRSRSFSVLLLLSVFCSFTQGYAAVLFTRDLGWNIDLIPCMIILPIISIICALPISYAGWGVRELLLIISFSFFGIPKEVALLVSISFGIVYTISCFPGGFFLMLSINKISSN